MKTLLTKKEFKTIESDLFYEGSFTTSTALEVSMEEIFNNPFTYAAVMQIEEITYVITKAENTANKYFIYSIN